MIALWRDHSRTIVGLTIGLALMVASILLWPKGGVYFDAVTLVAGALIALGVQGVIDWKFREINKPED